MSNSAQKDNKPSASKTEASRSRSAARTPPGAALPQMAPPPELVALQRVMQGHVTTDPPVQRKEAEDSTNAMVTPVVQRIGDDDGAPEEVVSEHGAQQEEQVDTSSVKPEQKETIEELSEYLRKVSVEDFVAGIQKLPERSTQLWALKFRSYDDEFMKLAMDTDWGMDLADELIRSPKNPIPNWLSIINHVNLGAVIPTKLGEVVQFLVVTLPHTIITGILNAIPFFVGYMMKPDPFFAAAIRGRYHVEIDASQWTSEEMRNLWNSFKKVPRTHIMGKVTGLERSGGMESSYNAGKIIMSKLIPQSVTMGGAENAQRPFTKFLMKRSKYSKRMRSKNAFSMTTLHEVGHAVDAKLKLMTTYGGRPEFGGWVDITPDEIFDKWAQKQNIGATTYSQDTQRLLRERDAAEQRYTEVRDRLGHQARPARTAETARDRARGEYSTAAKNDDDKHWEAQIGIPKSIFKKLGSAIAAGESLEAMVNAYVPIDASWDAHRRTTEKERRSSMLAAIKRLPPTRMVKHGKLSEMTLGFGWDVDRATGKNLAKDFDGKMYHEAYKNVWHGYNIAAKDHGVSHYQFRAPGEFFAELYAHYYLDTLTSKDKSKKHPLYDFIQKAVAENPECSPEVMTKGANQTIDSGPLQEQAADIPMSNVVVSLESGNEQQVPEQASLDQQSTASNPEKPQAEDSI